MSNAATSPARERSAASGAGDGPSRAEWAGVTLVLVAVCLRATTTFEPFPYWSTDPVVLSLPLTGLGPSASLATDAAMMLGTALLMLAAYARGKGPGLWECVLALAGLGAVAWHACFRDGFLVENALLGVTWAAAIFAGLGAACAVREPRLRRVLLATGFGLIGMLAAKGVTAVFVDHPMTVTEYKADPSRWLAAQGWSPGSASALAFERRLLQPEASGWFGLSNVYASLAAGLVPLFAFAAGAAWRRWRAEAPAKGAAAQEGGAVAVMLTIGAVCAIGALVLADSKGGFVACVLGVGLAAWWAIADRSALAGPTRRIAPILGIVLVVGAIAAVALRGALGEKIGELSILFRWFYLQASARVFADHPLLGVGPAEFKDAYLLAKNPLSPEEVSSPHSLLADFATTLGLCGIAWGALWLVWVRRAGAGLLLPGGTQPGHAPTPPTEPAPDPLALRKEMRGVLIIAAIVTAAGAMIEAPLASIPSSATRLVGLVLWILAGTALVHWLALPGEVLRRRLALACVPGLVLAVHTQIELTAVTPGSAGLLMLFVGIGAGIGAMALERRSEAEQTPAGAATDEVKRRGVRLWGPAVLSLAALALAVVSYVRTRSWETSLSRAVEPLAIIVPFDARASAFQAGEGRGDSWRLLASDMTASGAFGTVSGDPASISQILRHSWPRLGAAAEEELRKAAAMPMGSLQTMRALGHLRLQLAVIEPLKSREWTAAAIEQAEALTRRFPDRATAWSNLSGVLSAASYRPESQGAAPDPASVADLLRRAIAASERAARLDPYSTFHTIALAELCARSRDATAAAAWAKKTLELDAFARLDPLKRLNDRDRARMEELARAGK